MTDRRRKEGRADRGFKGFVVLYSHGNSEDLGQVDALITSIARRCGFTVVAFDYSGW